MNPQKNIKLDVNNFGQTIGYPVEGHLPKSLPYAKKNDGAILLSGTALNQKAC